MFSIFSSALAEEAAQVVEEVTEVAEEAEEVFNWNDAAISWLNMSKFGKLPNWVWVLIGILFVAGIVLVMVNRKKGANAGWSVKKMSVGAMAMALGAVLSMIRIAKMPMGGSVTPASMLPLLLFAYVYGATDGIILGVLYGLLQFFMDGMQWMALGVVANLFDYPIAFGLLGLAGIMGKKALGKNLSEPIALSIGLFLGCFGRFLGSFISGWVFYGEYAPYYGFNSGAIYSLCYNGAYMLPECIICILLGCMIGPRLAKELRKLN